MRIVQLLVIFCLVLSSGVLLLGDTSTELNEDQTDSRYAHGSDMTTQGDIELIILEDNPGTSNITWNTTTQVYDLPYPSEALRVIIHATGLEEDRNFVFSWQLYGIIGNRTSFGPIHHVGGASDSFSGSINLDTTAGQNEYNTSTFPGSSGIHMNQAPADQPGCYWVMATISDKNTHTNEVMTSNVSKFVSYGQPCPTEDQDGDGWSDAQEQQFNSDPTDPESNPHSMYVDLNESYGNLNESYGDLNESYGDLSESYGNLSILYGVCQDNNGLNEIEWAGTNESLAACQDDLVNATGCGDCNCSPSSGCLDTDDDGWPDDVELACGSNGTDNNSTPTNSTTHICWELEDDDGDGVRNIDDGCPAQNTSVGPDGCDIPCKTCIEGEQGSSSDDDDVSITGGGDVADLIVIGGASLLAGIGISSIFNRPGRGGLGDGVGKKPDIDIDIDDVGDVFDDLDVDLDIRPDLDLHKQKVKKSKVKSTGGSDQYFKSGVERQKAMTDTADPLLDDYVEEEKT